MLASTNTIPSFTHQIDLELNFSQWLAINGRKGRGCDESTINSYLSDLRQFIAWFEEHNGQTFSCELITSVDLRAYYNHSINIEHRSAATWNRRRISIKRFLQFCKAKGLIAFDPFQGVPIQEKAEEAPLSLKKDEYRRFVRVVEQSVNMARTDHQRRLAVRNRAMIALLIYAGVRQGEVCALRNSDLLLSERTGLVKIADGKGHKSGKVPLNCEARLAVSHWLEMPRSSEKVFEGITPRQVQRIVEKMFELAKIKATTHQLRHTFVSHVLDNTNLATAKTLARHSKIDQTSRYGLPHWEELERIVENQ
jgi:integrase/recombinase XerC